MRRLSARCHFILKALLMPAIYPRSGISLKTAALISAFGLLAMVVAAPLAEIYAYPRLVVRDDIAETIRNLSQQKSLFVTCILSYLLTFILDVIVAWSLYVYFKPVNPDVSMLAAWFRIVYTVLALVALFNLVSSFRIVTDSTAFTLAPGLKEQEVARYLNAFKSQWYFSLAFFSIHLVILGCLAIVSGYVPKIFGVLLIITGLGYSLTTFKPFLFPATNIDFAAFTFYGEIIFMLWLLIKGWRVKLVTPGI